MLEKIGSEAFRGASFEKFVAPGSLREIGDAVFFMCRNLKCVELNDKLERIGTLCFYGT